MANISAALSFRYHSVTAMVALAAAFLFWYLALTLNSQYCVHYLMGCGRGLNMPSPTIFRVHVPPPVNRTSQANLPLSATPLCYL